MSAPSDPDKETGDCSDPGEGSPPYGPGVTRQPFGAGIPVSGADEDLPETPKEKTAAEAELFAEPPGPPPPEKERPS